MHSVFLFGVDFRDVHAQGTYMNHSAKLIVKIKLPLTKHTVDALEPEDMLWVAWEDKLTGFGMRFDPSDAKSFAVNYCTDDNPASERTEARSLPRLGDALEDYIVSGHGRAARFKLTRSRDTG